MTPTFNYLGKSELAEITDRPPDDEFIAKIPRELACVPHARMNPEQRTFGHLCEAVEWMERLALLNPEDHWQLNSQVRSACVKTMIWMFIVQWHKTVKRWPYVEPICPCPHL